MVEKILHWLIGCAEFEIIGDHARFLNITAKSGFSLWGFCKRDGTACVTCRARDYKRLRPLARRCHVRLKCRRKSGLPFYVNRILHRKGMVIGVGCAVAIYAFLGSFVWGVSVQGTDTLTDFSVLNAAKKSGVYIGVSKKDFVPRLAAHNIIAELPELKWAAVNTDGCFVEISVSESAQTPQITDDTVWSNIVAGRAGTVLSIEAEHGRPEVSVGDTVAEGDLLISGLYQEKLDPYSPVPDDPYHSLGAARGSVIAETYREFTVEIPSVISKQQSTGRRQVNWFFNAFGLRLPLGLNTIPQGDFRAYSKTNILTALGTPLPVSIERDVYELTEQIDVQLTEEQQRQTALLQLREAQREALPDGGKVLTEELSFEISSEGCVLTARCRCEEEIAVLREVLVNQTKNE